MKPIRTFTVVPSLPAPLESLRDLAYNLRWAWNHEAIELFRCLDRELWETCGHNPVLMLGTIDQARLDAAAGDKRFLAHLDRVRRDLNAYMIDDSTWCQRTYDLTGEPIVAYFSAEFGLTDCLPVFAGGLGVLAGDHLKSASDLGVPLVGVGLLYQQGYFRQHLSEAGWQHEAYEENDFHNLPVMPERQADGSPITVRVPYPDREVMARVWRMQVGRVPLFLLDTNIPDNTSEDQDITDQLYGGDEEMRIKQEIMLGIGGFRALERLGLRPLVYHMNEGHSAFVALELARSLMATHGLSFAEAREAASASLVFTTHTPVAAGHDYFSAALMDRYFADYAGDLGLSQHDLLALGRQSPDDASEPFGMTILALRLAHASNGVSQLHGQITRQMWQTIWPGVPNDEVPIGQVTNGVHFPSWISQEMHQLYDRHIGPRWEEEPIDQTVWERVRLIPAEELWQTHEQRRESLVAFARRRLCTQLERRGAPQAEIEAVDEVFNPGALTIGFARRFTTYKRASLLFQDPDRLAGILNDPGRPVQVVFSGKAHPRDFAGKELIHQIVGLAREERFRRRIAFLEDYDMAVARFLVGGADVWLNTPRRGREASGTSGMKAAANGGLNLSTLDGWWDEAWRRSELEATAIGWAIGRGETYGDFEYQDKAEAEALYDLLERDVIPTFYDRATDGLPHRWIGRIKTSIGTLCHYFNSHRMVQEYVEHFYLPAIGHYEKLAANGMTRVKALAAWRARIEEAWSGVRVEAVDAEPIRQLRVGDEIHARAQVYLGDLTPNDVRVQFYLGRVGAAGKIADAEHTPMEVVGPHGEGSYLFEAPPIPCRKSGLNGYSVRVLPYHPELTAPFLPGLIAWAGTSAEPSP